MTLKEFRESYHNATGKASDLARSTNYSLIAIVWVLCGQDLAKVSSYRCVLIWLLLSLAIDYVQYLIMALFGTMKYRYEESKVRDKSKIDETPTNGYPEITPYLTTACFFLKFLFARVAVCCLVCKLTHL